MAARSTLPAWTYKSLAQYPAQAESWWTHAKHISRTYIELGASKAKKRPSLIVSAATFFAVLLIIIFSNLYRPRSDRTLILYAYHETDNARTNAEFFIKHGLHDGADFVFILNGETDLPTIIPKGRHISIVQRDNTCFDLGAYSEVLLAKRSLLLNKHDRFIMLNASIRGPFLPVWSHECWSEAYLSRLTDHVKLVGMSYNCVPFDFVKLPRHLQSMILATDRVGLDIFYDARLWGPGQCIPDMGQAVLKEMQMTEAVENAGYAVEALMTSFASSPDYVDTCTHGDISSPGAYFNATLHPYESMFRKANRPGVDEDLERLTVWHNGAEYSSQPVCGKNRKWKLVDTTEEPK